MTTQELNRDIKRLRTKLLTFNKQDLDHYFKFIDSEVKPEFKRLYYACSDFKNVNKNNILFMVRCNLSHRIIPFHHFGNMIEIEKL